MIKRERFPLSSILYYRIGGTARFLLEASTRDDVFEALDFVRANGIPRLVVVGLGSNLLFPDGPFDGAVLRIGSGGQRQVREVEEGLVEAFAGEGLDDVVRFGLARGYAGLEWAGGLPGTVGAAVRGNVGAFGGELKDVLDTAEVLDTDERSRTTRSLSNSELGFSYRGSVVKQSRKLVVLSATFRLRRVAGDELDRAEQTYRSNIEYRAKNHPMEYPNCGSVFKNVEKREQVEAVLAAWPDVKGLVESRWHGKVSIGYAVNRLGLVGYQVGGAQISPKHGNFIVNLGNASFSDVSAVVERVKQECFETFGFAPEVEVEIVSPSP